MVKRRGSFIIATGVDIRLCKHCGQAVIWWQAKSGKWCAYNVPAAHTYQPLESFQIAGNQFHHCGGH